MLVMLLRNRSRAVTSSKQGRMADHSSPPSPYPKHTTSISSFLGSPRFFNGFLSKSLSVDVESTMSPTSILDSKHISNFSNPFGYDRNLSRQPSFRENKPSHVEKSIPEGIGLALIDSLNDEEKMGNSPSKSNNSRMVLLGSKLKVQIPPLLAPSSLSPTESPRSPADFGIKTRNLHFLDSPSAFCSANSVPRSRNDSPPVLTGKMLSLSEMELSEDYTCVITRGPNPKTTHIFDNCIVESCCGVQMKKENDFSTDDASTSSPSANANFLSFCHNCKDDLGEGKDIYMYRGEKAFCSHECRCQEMLLENKANNSEEDDMFRI